MLENPLLRESKEQINAYLMINGKVVFSVLNNKAYNVGWL